MASTVKQRLRRFNGTDYDTVHLETQESQVIADYSKYAPAGYGSEGESIPTAGSVNTEAAFREAIANIYDAMPNKTVRRFYMMLQYVVPSASGDYLVELWRASSDYGTLTGKLYGGYCMNPFTSEYITASDVIQIHMCKAVGVWGPIRVENPPMAENHVYCTTESFLGLPVYARLFQYSGGVTGGSSVSIDNTCPDGHNAISISWIYQPSATESANWMAGEFRTVTSGVWDSSSGNLSVAVSYMSNVHRITISSAKIDWSGKFWITIKYVKTQ